MQEITLLIRYITESYKMRDKTVERMWITCEFRVNYNNFERKKNTGFKAGYKNISIST